MARFRKKPIEVDAIQYLGGLESADLVRAFAPGTIWHFNHNTLSIPTLEGTMKASVGDWIIRGVKGEVYPCKPDVFEATYEPARGREGNDGSL